MNIVVCIKQVPDTADIKWTKNNTIQREGLDSVINPFDEYAIESAIRIKEFIPDTNITVISMGPTQAKEAIKYALAAGCDNGILICDKRFSASDTIATANTIATVIKRELGGFDLIICGQFATDGDTAQTGPGIAEKLKIPQITYVRKIIDINNEEVIAEKEAEYGIETIKAKLPVLICMQKTDYELRQPKINGYIFAQNYNIKQISFEDTELNENNVGIKGSPTYVWKAYKADSSHNVKFIDTEELYQIIQNTEQDIYDK